MLLKVMNQPTFSWAVDHLAVSIELAPIHKTKLRESEVSRDSYQLPVISTVRPLWWFRRCFSSAPEFIADSTEFHLNKLYNMGMVMMTHLTHLPSWSYHEYCGAYYSYYVLTGTKTRNRMKQNELVMLIYIIK